MAQGGDIFLLEDEECSQLFITQEPMDVIGDIMQQSDDGMEVDQIFGVDEPIVTPRVSMFGKVGDGQNYSDISDTDEFEVKKPNFR